MVSIPESIHDVLRPLLFILNDLILPALDSLERVSQPLYRLCRRYLLPENPLYCIIYFIPDLIYILIKLYCYWICHDDPEYNINARKHIELVLPWYKIFAILDIFFLMLHLPPSPPLPMILAALQAQQLRMREAEALELKFYELDFPRDIGATDIFDG